MCVYTYIYTFGSTLVGIDVTLAPPLLYNSIYIYIYIYIHINISTFGSTLVGIDVTLMPPPAEGPKISSKSFITFVGAEV